MRAGIEQAKKLRDYYAELSPNTTPQPCAIFGWFRAEAQVDCGL
jgi:hypothetical protein